MTCTILLVDDQPQFLQLARALLSGDPRITVVAEAASGENALAMATSVKPDAVILDIHMPGIQGFETARALLDASPGLRIILVSSLDEPQYKEMARSVGATGFITKKEFSKEAILSILGYTDS